MTATYTTTHFQCLGCGMILKAEGSALGRRGCCSKCGYTIFVPSIAMEDSHCRELHSHEPVHAGASFMQIGCRSWRLLRYRVRHEYWLYRMLVFVGALAATLCVVGWMGMKWVIQACARLWYFLKTQPGLWPVPK